MRTRTGIVRYAVVVAVLASTLVVAAAEPAHAVACDAVSQDVWGTGAADCRIDTDYGSVVWEQVQYDTATASDLNGRVCRRKAAGSYPIIVLNHSGFSGFYDTTPGTLDYWAATLCHVYALAGYYAIAPDYRQFNTSPPDRFCDGEVSDVLGMLDRAKTHAHADPDRVLMRGWSHGACITLRAYQQGVDGLVAAAAIAGPTDMDGLWQFLTTSLSDPSCLLAGLGLAPAICTGWYQLKLKLEGATGGPPNATTQPEYDARSVDQDLAGLHDSSVPLFIASGVDENVVPIAHTCATVAGVNAIAGGPDFAGYHFTSNGTALTSAAVTGCSGFTWNTASNPVTTGFPATHYLFVYDGYAHFNQGSTVEYNVMDHANKFLVAKTPPP